MNKLSTKEQLEICDQIDKKKDQLSAIVVSLVAMGINAMSKDGGNCFPSESQSGEILQTMGQMADNIQLEIGELTVKLAESLN